MIQTSLYAWKYPSLIEAQPERLNDRNRGFPLSHPEIGAKNEYNVKN